MGPHTAGNPIATTPNSPEGALGPQQVVEYYIDCVPPLWDPWGASHELHSVWLPQPRPKDEFIQEFTPWGCGTEF